MKMIDECALPFPGKIMTSTTFDSPTGSSVTSKHKPCKALQLTDIEQGPESYVDRSNLAESQHQQHQKHLASLQFLITVLIFLIGAAASATILVSGINSAKRDQENDFEKVSSDLLVEFDVALNDYLVAGQWVHQAFRTSRKGSQTQRDFAEMYENLISTGLEFQAVTLAMNVSANEREAMENESRDFVKQYHPSINYTGFRAFGDGSTIPAPQAPFYFPVHFIAPMELSGKNLDLNLYTSTTRKNAIDKALQTWKPVLTEPAILGHQIGEESPALRSVILVHPGIPLSSRPDVVPRDAVFMGIRIPDVIRRAHKNLPLQKCRVSVFLYDSTDTTRENQPFLGGAMMNEYRDGGIAEDSNTDDDGVVFTPATELSSVLARKDHYHHSIVYPIASREWTFVVVASKDEFSSNITFVILSAVMFFVACTCTALWVHTHYRRVAKMTELRSKVETEKHAIVVENARNATRLEREMNDFIAHEVRNPLAAAVSACSFVSCAVNETQPLVDDKSRASVREDVAIIDTSLQFINDLLRNMLDMHRASSNQLVIETSPVSILDDILQPVTSMLYRRGMDIEFLVDCPQNLIVESDRLRLKQIVLNLGRNAVKFVEKGFVRFRAGLVKGRVYLYIEDSGPGIPLKKRHNLFAKFQESLDSMSQGTGFGLFLCKKLIELMDGDIWLDESYDSGVVGCPGTRFVIDLKTAPISVDHSITGTEAEVPDPNSSPAGIEEPDAVPQEKLPTGLSVLCVDDDLILRKLFCRSVRKHTTDWKICDAASGETALRLVEDQEFDLIFLDQYMSSADRQLLGTETARALRSKGVQSTICGLSANDLETSFIESGANAFMMKPFPCDGKTLTTELLRVLASAKSCTGDLKSHGK